MSVVTGECLTGLDFGPKFRETYGYPYIVVHRRDLLAALLDACRASPLVTLRSDRKVHGLGQGAEEVVVACADGSTYRARAVVGADGVWSTVRRFTVGDDELVCSRDVAYRGTAPIEAVPEHSGLDVVWWAGPKMHLIQYPIRRGELLHDREPVGDWTRGRVTLLGDAAHPMLQYLAQGACMALEDAVCLADSMWAHSDDPAKAFLDYQRERIPRTSKAQRWARGMGELVHLDGMGALLRDMVIRDRADDDYAYVDWLYGYGAEG